MLAVAAGPSFLAGPVARSNLTHRSSVVFMIAGAFDA